VYHAQVENMKIFVIMSVTYCVLVKVGLHSLLTGVWDWFSKRDSLRESRNWVFVLVTVSLQLYLHCDVTLGACLLRGPVMSTGWPWKRSRADGVHCVATPPHAGYEYESVLISWSTA